MSQPLDDVRRAGAVQRIELNAGMSFGVHPHDFAFAFDSWAGRQIESELHRNPGLKETKGSNSHSSFAQIGSKCAVLHAIIEKGDWNHQLVTEIAFAFLRQRGRSFGEQLLNLNESAGL